MSASDTALATLTAQWYNSLTTGLSLAPSEFQLAQGELIVPINTQLLWNMMDQVPVNSAAQYYTPASLLTLSSEYQSILSKVRAAETDAFEKGMGTSLDDWEAARKAYASNPANQSIFANPPSSVTKALLTYFSEWSQINMDPSQAATCYTLYEAIYDNPIYIAQQLIANLPNGGVAAYNLNHAQLLVELAKSPGKSLTMDSSTQSSDLSNSWANSSSSAGGSYFYTSSSSSQSTDFTQAFASDSVTIEVEYQSVATIPVVPLSSGPATDGAATYLPWFYPAALTEAYQNDDSSVWIDPTQWATYFSGTGALQYVVTDLIVVDGITQTVTSAHEFSKDEQTYAASQSNSDYGCWPYYVSNSSSSATSTSTTFDDQGRMTTTTHSLPGNPVVLGVLVSSVKDLETG